MKNKQTIIITTLLLACVVLFSIIAYRQIVTSTILNEQQIKTRVEALYGGDVQNTIQKGSQYVVTFTVDDYVYEVVANKEYGTLEKLTLIKEGTQVEPIPTEPEQPTPERERLTKQQVIAIAKQQAAGEIDEIEYYENSNGGYYIVEIENDGDDVTLQIHAITGKILSVSFED